MGVKPIYQLISYIIEVLTLTPLSLWALILVLQDGFDFSYKKELGANNQYLFFAYLAYIFIDLVRMYIFPSRTDPKNYFHQGFSIFSIVMYFTTGWFGKIIAFYVSYGLTTSLLNIIVLSHTYKIKNRPYKLICMIYALVFILHRLVFGTYVASCLINSVIEWRNDETDPPRFDMNLTWIKFCLIGLPIGIQVINFVLFSGVIIETIKRKIPKPNPLLQATDFYRGDLESSFDDDTHHPDIQHTLENSNDLLWNNNWNDYVFSYYYLF